MIRIGDNGKVLIKTQKSKQPLWVDLDQIIHTISYFEAIGDAMVKQFKSKKKDFDRSKIFKYTQRAFQEKHARKKHKDKFGVNTIIIESAPLNTRNFDENQDENNNESEIIQIIPINKQLLSYFNYHRFQRIR